MNYFVKIHDAYYVNETLYELIVKSTNRMSNGMD